MGYNTQFKGVLKFKNELTMDQLRELRKYLDEDCRAHPEWEGCEGLTYIDLKLNKSLTGLMWNGAEKTYDLPEKINFVVESVQEKFPEFGLTGTLFAQGEEAGDVYYIQMVDGVAKKTEIELPFTDDQLNEPL